MPERESHVVTGAFGYSGQYIARRLLAKGRRVRTLTSATGRQHSLGHALEARPFEFDNPNKLVDSLHDASVLYNTYWIRFNYRTFGHSEAVENTLTLFAAAKAAGVERIVHVSITNPSEDSPLEYFHGKARLERALRESGLSYAILRPTVLFGKQDILINNIAWALRHFPVFLLFGSGEYRIQPIYVDDLAKLAVEQGESRENCVIDAIGPETFTYRQLVEAIASAIGSRRPTLGSPATFAHVIGKVVGWIKGDVMITRDEIRGLTSDLLCTGSPPAGQTKLTDWLAEHADELGQKYRSEVARRRNRRLSYDDL